MKGESRFVEVDKGDIEFKDMPEIMQRGVVWDQRPHMLMKNAFDITAMVMVGQAAVHTSEEELSDPRVLEHYAVLARGMYNSLAQLEACYKGKNIEQYLANKVSKLMKEYFDAAQTLKNY